MNLCVLKKKLCKNFLESLFARCTKCPISLVELCVCVDWLSAQPTFFVLDPKRHCVPFAPHYVRSSTALRMTQTKKCRAKRGRIYKEVTHIVRCTLTLTNFLVSLFLLTQEAQKVGKRRQAKSIFV